MSDRAHGARSELADARWSCSSPSLAPVPSPALAPAPALAALPAPVPAAPTSLAAPARKSERKRKAPVPLTDSLPTDAAALRKLHKLNSPRRFTVGQAVQALNIKPRTTTVLGL
jgi:hypothetical protein